MIKKQQQQSGLQVTSCDQTVPIPQPLALHHGLCGLSGAKEMLPQASAEAPIQKGSWENQYFNNSNNTKPHELGETSLCVFNARGQPASLALETARGSHPVASLWAAYSITAPVSLPRISDFSILSVSATEVGDREIKHQRNLKQDRALWRLKAHSRFETGPEELQDTEIEAVPVLSPSLLECSCRLGEERSPCSLLIAPSNSIY